jgi:ligand-binding sensor domain-containing protein
MKHVLVYTLFLLSGFHSSCGQNQTVTKDLSKDHPNLIKTIGNRGYGNVQCGLQDKAGNLWFGTTENGLYKYDGKSFRQFLVADGLISNNIYCLLEDKDGKIWIGTYAGLCLYDGKTFAEIKIPYPKNLLPNENPNYRNSHWVYNIMQAKSGKLWFVTIDGVYIYDGKSFTQFLVNEIANGFLTSSDKAERILEDKAGNIWFGGRSNEGVYRYDGKSVTKLTPEELFQNGPRPKPHNWGWPQLQDKNGNIWFSNWGGAYRYDGKSFTGFTKKDGLPGMVTRIIEDKKGNLWFGGDGICRYDGKSFTCFTQKDGLASQGVWSILEDTSGNLWVGTRATDLYFFNGKTFISYSEYRPQPVTD